MKTRLQVQQELDTAREKRGQLFVIAKAAGAAADAAPSDAAAAQHAEACIGAVQDADARIGAITTELREVERTLIASLRTIDADPAPGYPRALFSGGAGAVTLARSVSDALRASGIIERAASGAATRGELALSLRTLLGSGTGGYGIAPTQVAPVPGYYAVLNRIVNFVPHVPVGGPAVQYNRVKLKDGETGAEEVAEGALKPQVEIDSVPGEGIIKTFAGWEKSSTQLLSDFPGCLALIESILMATVLDAIDAHVVAMIATTGNHTVFTPAVGETVLESAARAATALASKGSRAIVVALNPNDLLTAGLTKAADSGLYLGAPYMLTRQGVQVVESASVAEGDLIAFDASGRGVQYFDRQSVGVQVGMAGEDFIRNLRTILAEARGLAVTRDPNLVLYGEGVGAVS